MSAPPSAAVTVAGVRVTHPERVLFEELGLTKQALARYYEAAAEHLLPDLRNRPLALVRCPQGPGEGCFFQKHIDAAWSDEIDRVTIAQSDGDGVYAVANTDAAVVGLVQKGVIELHVWGATTRDLGKPDRMVFDLDPDPLVPWREVMAATRRVRERVESLGLEAFLKTSGGKGLHVMVPLAPKHEWDEVKEFSRAIAQSLAAEEPRLFTTNMAKKERTRRIFIDYLRNAPGATTVAAYSVRARRGAPVSTPLHWDELGGRMKPTAFHAANVVRRLQGLHSDPWKAFRRKSQTLTAAMKRKIGLES
ncbi:MAG TPA: non-homologous end-joining DNA ligase [Usitatibacter sp.]|jgi:bifunctional non-homologous end joining protein LigD|nr:non-homologous end-joining DNA ligase [Usitatibacter sp.]